MGNHAGGRAGRCPCRPPVFDAGSEETAANGQSGRRPDGDAIAGPEEADDQVQGNGTASHVSASSAACVPSVERAFQDAQQPDGYTVGYVDRCQGATGDEPAGELQAWTDTSAQILTFPGHVEPNYLSPDWFAGTSAVWNSSPKEAEAEVYGLLEEIQRTPGLGLDILPHLHDIHP